jgi:hypothetical protein
MYDDLDAAASGASLQSAFDSLKSQRAVLSESFSQNLEDRLMKASKSRRSKRAWVVAAACALGVLLAGASVGYATTDGFKSWPWSVYFEDDGTITNSDGEVIGGVHQDEDGAETATIQMGEGHISIRPISKIEMNEDGELAESPTSMEDLKGKQLQFQIAP